MTNQLIQGTSNYCIVIYTAMIRQPAVSHGSVSQRAIGLTSHADDTLVPWVGALHRTFSIWCETDVVNLGIT